MAGEGTGALATYRYSLINSGGKPFSVEGNGPDDASAKSEANAKLALTVGTILRSSKSVPIAALDLGAPKNSTDQYEDATIVVSKTVGGNIVSRTIKINNMSTTYKLANTRTGQIDGNNADVAAFCAAFLDSDGLGGYTFSSGHFHS